MEAVRKSLLLYGFGFLVGLYLFVLFEMGVSPRLFSNV